MAASSADDDFVADINVTPFVDVMLVLLIIFMVTAPMMTEGLDVALPKVETSEVLPTDDDHVILTVKTGGALFLNEHIAFTDFESGFKPQNHILGLILKERLGAVFVDDLARADLLIYSIFGNAARYFKGPRLFYTEEPVLPRWKEGCYSLTSLRDGTLSGDRHFRFPAWLNADYIRRTGHIEQYSSVPGDIVNRHEKSLRYPYVIQYLFPE